MKPRIEHGDVHSSHQPDFVFGFDTSDSGARKAFSVLSASLYSDKIKAVVREIVSNAIDAHTEAQCTEQVSVSVPTRLNPSFRVRDYGKGLKRDEIQRVYCTLFSSSKDTSNTYTGYLGLGSKSPFAYTSTFVVESCVETEDGSREKTVYSLVRDGENIPSVSVVSTSITDEPTGLHVIVPVTMYDFGDFASAVAYYYPYWDGKVNTSVPIQDRQVVIDRTELVEKYGTKQRVGYRVVKGNRFGILFVMGNVPYDAGDPFKSVMTYNRGISLEIYVKTGDISVAPSRENLSYDKSTTAFTQAIVKQTKDKILKSIIDQIAQMETWQDAVNMASAGYEIVRAFSSYGHDDFFQCSYKNGKIFVNHTEEGISIVNHHGRLSFDIEDEDLKIRIVNGGVRQNTTSTVGLTDKIKFYTNDVKSGGIGRLRNESKMNRNTYHYLISDKIRDILIKCGLPESFFYKTSALQKVTRSASGPRITTGKFVSWGGKLNIVAGTATHSILRLRGKYIGPDGQPIKGTVLHELIRACSLDVYFTTDKTVTPTLWTELQKMYAGKYHCSGHTNVRDYHNILGMKEIPILKKIQDAIDEESKSISYSEFHILNSVGIRVPLHQTKGPELLRELRKKHPILSILLNEDHVDNSELLKEVRTLYANKEPRNED